ncbi:arsenical efflux pump membrane protein ArsB [Deinococcus metallilatus]|uniref:Arsenical pump membrane protein n=1 Tax=Deinococcus metallilatus TaxID=1211322 RepID=A0AAJ5JY76_9DEIO|nr:arsenical efflux pump membrane protein ArsB [Deinococcus metallilatus]MBB5296018.1 arsenical pump membrane protein [Deinococcus metallilatus]QBY08163.1 arsenical efflux pump membrane protein ArsB [Deinococcus metallilatus]RXJ11895.1 arsenical efflux pump membrane protein ArsB [Deinococcus metallilatus]TLK25873.1 arsenical efflux pump membrane protein ArsB [Deinococcus metallilatus]GMA14447.1 arsenical pump membrane protein [Deinococcus metallilatus]
MLAVLIVLLTVALVVWRPRGLDPAWAAALGAASALLVGVVHLSDLPPLWDATWNATLTLVALIVLSLLLDAAGFFRWAALHVARWGGGRGRRLLTLLVVFSALVAAVFANDGGVLILTPLVLELAALLSLPRAATLAFALAVGFVVDAASLPLTISNLTNIIAADAFGLGFGEYARVMVPVDLAVVLACVAVLLAVYGRTLPRRYDLAALPEPGSAVRSWGVFRAGWAVTPLLLAGAFLASRLHVPLSAVVGTAAALVWLVAARSGNVSSRAVLRSAPWNVVIFSLAMYTVVFGLRGAGITGAYGEWLAGWAGRGTLPGVLAGGLSVAGLSAGLNNLPALLTALLGIRESGVGGPARDALLYGAVVGADIGPKLTPLGSLATLLWLHVLGGRGLKVSWGEYLRAGLVLTPPVLLVALLTLWGVLAAR